MYCVHSGFVWISLLPTFYNDCTSSSMETRVRVCAHPGALY